MKVLFLTKYPIEGASSRYRVFQYLPALRDMGIECTVSSFMDSDMYRATFSPGRFFSKTCYFVRAVVTRLRVLRNCDGYDLIFMQRELLPFGPLWIEEWLRRRGVKLIFDYDDALFLHQPSKLNPIASLLRSSERVFQIFKLVDCVLAGNNYLADMARSYCPDSRKFEVAEDISRFTAHPRKLCGEKVVIGWLGSWTTERYLHLIEEALAKVLDTYPHAMLHVVGGGDFQLAMHEVKHLPWSLGQETALVADFDIGIMPLPLEDWSRGKSGGKARTYMAAGIPVVCSAIGYNKDLVEDKQTGFLVETQAEWIQALSALIESPELRRSIGNNAQQYVAENFSLEKQSRELASILAEVATTPGNAYV